MRKWLFPAVLLAGLSFLEQPVQAQKKAAPKPQPETQKQADLKQFKNWKPRAIGPAGMSGRITAIDALADNPNVILLGSASVGVW